MLSVRNADQTTVNLILLDVNDNAPEMPTKTEYELDENASQVEFCKLSFDHFVNRF